MAYEIVIGRNESDKEKFGLKGAVSLGRHYVKMGQITSLSNNILLDINRSHIIFICGKRGCLTEDTFIFTDKGYKKLIDFKKDEDLVLSFNKEKEEFEWEKDAELLSYSVDKEELYEIILKDGQKLIATSEHPFLIHEKGKNCWKISSELKLNDEIVSTNFLPEVKLNKESKRIARLLGFLLADGTMQIRRGIFKDGRGYLYNGNKARLRIVNGDLDVIKQASKDIDLEFKVDSKVYKKGKENCYVVETKHQKIINKLNLLGVPLGKKDKKIRVPDIVWKSSNKFKKEFIKALFSCDGFVDKNGSRVVYYSNSLGIIKDLNLLLAHFSIHSRVREKKTTCRGKRFLSYLLDIMDYQSIRNFINIGFFNKEKANRLKKRKFNQMRKRKCTIYLKENLFCQKIVSIKKVNNIDKVYDLRVKKNHSFIANGIISHNSGKSYTMGAIAEGISDLPKEIAENTCVLIFDTMGIYWTMKYPNYKDRELLKEWGLEGKGLDIKLYAPVGFFQSYKEKGIPVDKPFSIKPSELSSTDWCNSFSIDANSSQGVLIERIINKLKNEKKEFSIQDILHEVQEDFKSDDAAKQIVSNQFSKADNLGLFSEEGTKLKDIIAPGQVTVLDISAYVMAEGSSDVRALVIGLISKKLFIERMVARKKEEYTDVHRSTHFFEKEEEGVNMPLVWLMIDEAHEFLPADHKTSASDALITILREGREPGISLILASQQPGKIHTDVMTQSDVVIAHRVTAKIDVDALGMLMQSYMRRGLDAELNTLPKARGAAVVFDDMNERIYPMKVRPRYTWHGGEAPSAIKPVKESIKL